MNRAFRLVWSKSLNALVVVSEITKGRGKGGQRSQAVTASEPREFSLTALANAIRSALSGAFKVSKGATVAMSAPVLISGAVSVGATLAMMSEANAQVASDVVLYEDNVDAEGFVSVPGVSFVITGEPEATFAVQNATIGGSNFDTGLYVDMANGEDATLTLSIGGSVGTVSGNVAGIFAEGDGSASVDDDFSLIVGPLGVIRQIDNNGSGEFSTGAVEIEGMTNVLVELQRSDDNRAEVKADSGDGIVIYNIADRVTFRSSGNIESGYHGVHIDTVGGEVDFTNNASGVILSVDQGLIVENVSGNVSVINNGLIGSGDSGILVVDSGSSARRDVLLTIENNGNILSAAVLQNATSEASGDFPSSFAIEVLGFGGSEGLSNTNSTKGPDGISATIDITNTGNITNSAGGGIGIIGYGNNASGIGLYVNNLEPYTDNNAAVDTDAGPTLARVVITNTASGNITSVGDGIAIGAVTTGGDNALAFGVRSESLPNNGRGASRGDVLVEISNLGAIDSEARGIAIFANADANASGPQDMTAVALWAENDVTVNITNAVGGVISGKEGGVFIGATERSFMAPINTEEVESFSIYSQAGDITIRVLNSGTIEANTTSSTLSGSRNDPAAVLIEEVFAKSGEFNLRINNEATGKIENKGVGAGVRIVGDPQDSGEDYISFDDANVRINNNGTISAANGEGVSVENIESNIGVATVSVYNWQPGSRIHTNSGIALNISGVRAQHNFGLGDNVTIDIANFGEISSNAGSAIVVQAVTSEALDTAVRLTNSNLISGVSDSAAVRIFSIGEDNYGSEGVSRPWQGENVLVDVVNSGTIRNLGSGNALEIGSVESAQGDVLVRVDNSNEINVNLSEGGWWAVNIDSVSADRGIAAVEVVNNGTMQGGISIAEVRANGLPGITVGTNWEQSNAYSASVTVLNGNGSLGSGDITANNSSAINIDGVGSYSGPASVVVNNKGHLIAGEDGIAVLDVNSALVTTAPVGDEFDPAGFTNVTLYGRLATVEVVNTGDITANASIGTGNGGSVAGIRVENVSADIVASLSDPAGNLRIGDVVANVSINNSGELNIRPDGYGFASGIRVFGVEASVGANTVGVSNVSSAVSIQNNGVVEVGNAFSVGTGVDAWRTRGIEVSGVLADSQGSGTRSVVANVSVESFGDRMVVIGEDSIGISVNRVEASTAEGDSVANVSVVSGVASPEGFRSEDLIGLFEEGSVSFEGFKGLFVAGEDRVVGISVGSTQSTSTVGNAQANVAVNSQGNVFVFGGEDSIGSGARNATYGILVDATHAQGSGNASAEVSVLTSNGSLSVFAFSGNGAGIAVMDTSAVSTTNGYAFANVSISNGYDMEIFGGNPYFGEDMTGIKVSGVSAESGGNANASVSILNSGDIRNSFSLLGEDIVSPGAVNGIVVTNVSATGASANVSVSVINTAEINVSGYGILVEEVLTREGANGTIEIGVTNQLGAVVHSQNSNGVKIDKIGTTNTKSVSVSVNNSGTISSGDPTSWAVEFNEIGRPGASTANVTLNNLGADSKILAASESGEAVQFKDISADSFSAVVALNNGGLLSGRVAVENVTGSFALTNSVGATWNVKDGEGEGEDAFSATGSNGVVTINNAGEINLYGNATLSGMNEFINSGTVNVTADGGEFSVVNLEFVGSNFTAQAGSTFVIDALLGNVTTTTSDQFVFSAAKSGNVTITGTTNVRIVDSDPTDPGVNNPIGSVVIASIRDEDATANGAFVLESGPLNKGLWQYDLFASSDVQFNVTSGGVDAGLGEDKVWRLASTPSHHAFELPVMMTAAQDAWHRSASVITDRFSELRAKREEASSPKSGLWAKVVGAQQQRDLKNSYALYGKSFDFKTDYDQSIYGLLLGLDHVINTGDDSRWLLGVSGGILRSNTKFDTTATKMDYDITSVGLYASYSSGGVFFNALVKQDSGDTDYSMSNRKLNSDGGIRYSEKFDTRVLGGALEAGYRFLGQNGFVEPSIRVATATAKVKDREFLATDVDFENGKSTRSSLSLTSGYTTTWQGSKAEPYLQISLINESGADNKVRLTSGGQDPVTVKDGDLGTMGQVAVGLRVFGSKGSHGYLRADYTGNSDTKSYSISGGLKWNW